MKTDRCQSKGVARGAFCKRLKRNGMDEGKYGIGQEGDPGRAGAGARAQRQKEEGTERAPRGFRQSRDRPGQAGG
jgi:hypothetical protein